MAIPTLYFVRHGETDWNVAGRYQGWRDIPLNDCGRTQASQTGVILNDLLARHNHHPERLDFVTSPLARARETMHLMRGALGLSHEGYAFDDRLREISYGEWEGLTVSDMQASYPDLFAAREADKWNFQVPGGETYVDTAARLKQWVASLTRTTVAVAHSGTARALMVAMGVAPAATAGDLLIEQGAVYVFADGGVTLHREAVDGSTASALSSDADTGSREETAPV